MDEKKLILQCDCHSGHFVVVNYLELFKGDPATVYFELLGDFHCQNGLWDRVKGAFSILFGGHWCWAEVLLDKEKMARLQAFLAEVGPQITLTNSTAPHR